MAVQDFVQRVETSFQGLQELAGPIGALPEGQWQRELSADGDTEANLGSIGSLRLSGSIRAEAFLTKTPQPPFDLESPIADDGSGRAFGSARIAGQAGANFETNVAGAGWKAGVEAGASKSVAWTVHRRFAQSSEALGALSEVVRRVAQNPFTESYVLSMEPGEAFQFDLEGRAAIHASAGMEYGLFREFKPGVALGVQEPIGVKAGVKAAITVQAGIEGQLHVRVLRQDGSSKRRVQLIKQRGSTVGIGVGAAASLQLTQVDPFVKSLMNRLFEIPDDLAEEVKSLSDQIGKVQERLDALEEDAKAAVEEVLDGAVDAVGLDRIGDLVASLDAQSEPVRSALGPVRAEIGEVLARVDATRADLTEFVGDAFEDLSAPIERVSVQLARWLDAYSRLKARLRDSAVERARKGIELELKAAISRSRSREALVDLEFDVSHERAMDTCVKAMLGDFTDALMAARADGAHGVELRSCVLKETVQRRRSFSLTASFFGFEVGKSVQDWTTVTVEKNSVTGTVEIIGQAGASLAQKLGAERDDFTFVFDFFGGSRDEQGRGYLGPNAGYEAQISRGGSTSDANEIAFDLESHLALAAAFGPLPEPNRDAIREAIEQAQGPYEYSIYLAFSPEAARRAFLLDQPSLGAGAAFDAIWQRVRHASRLLGYSVRDVDGGLRPFSSFLNPSLPVLESTPDVQLADFHVHLPPGQAPLTQQSVASILVRARNAYYFARGYAQARSVLLEGGSAGAVAKALRKMARRTRTTTGTFGEPLDAKFVALALVAGQELMTTSFRFSRGDVAVEL